MVINNFNLINYNNKMSAPYIVAAAFAFVGFHIGKVYQNRESFTVKSLNNGNFKVGDYTTKYYHICGASGIALKELAKSKPELALDYARDEDSFLKYEFDVMCKYHKNKKCPSNSKSESDKMKKLSKRMEQKYGLEYIRHHSMHIETTATCKGSAPSTKMTFKSMKC